MSRIVFTVFVLALGLFGSAQTTREDADLPRFLVTASGPTGSTWYPVATVLADIWMEEFSGLNVSVVEGSGLGNLHTVQDHQDGQIGFTFMHDFLAAGEGREPFEAPYDNVGVVMALYPSLYYVVVMEGSPIESIGDLPGRHFAPGEQNFSGELMTRIVLDSYGLDYDAIRQGGGRISFGGYSDMATMLRDGILDAASFLGSPGSPIISEIDATRPVRIIGMNPERAEELEALGLGYVRSTVPAGTYRMQTEEVDTISIYSIVFASRQLSEDAVYNLTRAVWENVERLQENQPARAHWLTPEFALAGTRPEDLHPGALRYYREIGLLN
ncbi:MAG: TAXI family TRAP transporter solute-binding subunit [Deinococcota bacterium]|nr:TAXI family TRAP transporter solute-binding subunit [Deinococcota bacterium]